MKRSSAISLAIVGALALSTSACSNAPEASEPTTYRNVTECVQDGKSQATCDKAFADAKTEAEKTAPKFASQAECAAQFGNCQQSASGGWFMPALMGYMVGNMMSNNGGGTRYVSQPVYVDRSGRDVTSSYSGGRYQTSSAAPTASVRSAQRASAARSSAATSSRGGFGSSSRGGYGG